MSASLPAQIKQVIVDELNLPDQRPEDIDDDAPLFGEGLGLDSLDALQLAVAIEERFGVRIPEGDESRSIFRSVSTIAAFIERSRTPSP
jgi:acyl carrier protein